MEPVLKKVQVEDRGGNSLNLIEINGRYYTPLPEESLKGAFSFKARPEDIIICAYPKAGTHWTNEVVRCLLAGDADLPVVEKIECMLECATPAFLNALPSPRNVNTHFYFDVLSPDILKNKSKVIYITRDPRDIAVSFFSHHRKFTCYYDYDGTWEDYFPLLLEGKVDFNSWFDYTKSWEKGIAENPDHPILTLTYEEMKKNPLKEIQKISDFIGVKRSKSFLEEVVRQTSFGSMSAKRKDIENPKFVNSKVIYRKGEIGDWKNTFTVAQSETFDEAFEREMKGTKAYDLYSRAHIK